jgi:hypothetical protein
VCEYKLQPLRPVREEDVLGCQEKGEVMVALVGVDLPTISAIKSRRLDSSKRSVTEIHYLRWNNRT